MTFDRIADDPRQHLWVERPLDQIILRPFPHGRQRQFLIIRTRQHHDRHRGRGLVGLNDCFQTVAVRQGKIQEHDVKLHRGQLTQGVSQAFRVGEVKLRTKRRRHAFTQQVGGCKIVFD